MIDLTGKVALVTGGSRGIGRAIVLKLASLGAQVVVNYQSQEAAAHAVVAEVEAAGGRAMAVQGDVRSPEDAQRMVKATVETFGRLDILVNNAGTTRDMLLAMMKESDWDTVIDISMKGCFNCTKAAMRPMMKQRSGRIINITSVSGIMGNAGQSNYSAAKAGVIGFTKAVAREIAPRNVTVNAVAPGYVRTDLTADLPAELLQKMMELTPLGREGTGEDIANAVAFLASDAAGYITGQVLCVDGGMAM